MERLVAQLLLHAVVLQKHARVTGKCFEQGSVVCIERRDVPQAVGDEEKSERVLVATKGRNERVADSMLGEVRVNRMWSPGLREENRRLSLGRCDRGDGRLGQRHGLQQGFARGRDDTAQRTVRERSNSTISA